MELRTFVSSSRFSANREIIWQQLREICSQHAITLPEGADAARYDCNLDDSTLREQPKQDQYLETIRHKTDLFVAILDGQKIGYYTYLEICCAYESFLKTGFPICLILDDKQPVAYDNSAASDVDRDCLSDRITELSLQYAPHRRRAEISVDGEETEKLPHFFTDYNHPAVSQGQSQTLAEVFGRELAKLFDNERLKMRRFTKRGSEVSSEEIMHRRGRPENGYVEGVYFERAFDREELANPTSQFVLIKGLPGAGKSRALLRHINDRLRDEQVIVLHSYRFRELFETLFQEDRGCFRSDGSVVREHYYLIIDELDKFLLNLADKEDFARQWERLCDEVFRTSRLHLYATTTLEGYETVREWVDTSNVQKITIGALDPGDADDARILRYFGCQSNRESLTVGFIVPRGYDIDQYVSKLLEDDYIRTLCLAYKTVCIFSRNNRQLLRYTLMAANDLLVSRNQPMQPDRMAETLTELIAKGVIRLFDSSEERKEIDSVEFNFRKEEQIEGARVFPIVAAELTFYFDDILLDRIFEHPVVQRFSEDRIIDTMVSAFPMLETYSKAITRTQDKKAVWKYIHDRYADEILRNECRDYEERRRFLSVLITYAPTFDVALQLIDRYADLFPLGSLQIAGLYSHQFFALRDKREIPALPESIRQAEQQLTEYELYYIRRKIELAGSYAAAQQLIQKLCPEVFSMRTGEIDSYELFNIKTLLNSLCLCALTFEEMNEALGCYQEWNTNNPSYAISFSLWPVIDFIRKHKEKRDVLDQVFEQWVRNADPQLFANRIDERHHKTYIVGNIIKAAADYPHALSLIERLSPDEMYPHFLTSMITKWDYIGKAKDFEELYGDIERIRERFRLDLSNQIYGAIMQKAPDIFKAEQVLSQVPYTDNYILNHYLHKITQNALQEVFGFAKLDRETNQSFLTTACNLVKKAIPTINPEGVICNCDGSDSRFAGVRISLHSLHSLYKIFRHDPQWVEQLIVKCKPIYEEVRRNEPIYATRIRSCSSYADALALFRLYEANCLLPAMPDIQRGKQRIDPSCLINVLGVLSQNRDADFARDREEIGKLFERYRPYMDLNAGSYAVYYAVFSEKIFADADALRFSDEFVDMLDRTGGNPHFMKVLLHNCPAIQEFRQVAALYCLMYDRYEKTGHESFKPESNTPNKLIQYVHCIEEFEELQALLLARKIPINKDASKAMYRFAARNKIEFRASRLYDVTEEDDLKRRIAQCRTLAEVIVLLEEHAVAHEGTIHVAVFEYAIGKIKELLDEQKKDNRDIREQATIELKRLRTTYKIRCTQKTLNRMLWIYYPQQEKERLLEEIGERFRFDSYTYVAVLSDWACDPHIKWYYYERMCKEYVNEISPKTHCTMLKQELKHVFDSGSKDFAHVVKVLREMEAKEFFIHYSVFEKLDLDCRNSRQAEIRTEVADFKDIRRFLFIYMLRHVYEEDAPVVYAAARRNGIEL